MPTPVLKLYRGGEYIGSMKHAEDAAMLMQNDGDEIRYGHDVTVWAEGKEDQPAAESYDHVAEVVAKRINDHQYECRKRVADAVAKQVAKT